MKKLLIAALAVLAIAAAAFFYLGNGRSASASRPGRARDGIVITYRMTVMGQDGSVKSGTRTTYYIPESGEFRTVTVLDGEQPREHGFTRSEGGVQLYTNRETGEKFIKTDPNNPKTSNILPPAGYGEASLRSHRQFVGETIVAGRTAFTHRTYRDPETKRDIGLEESFYPDVPIPVKVVWFTNNQPDDAAEAVSVVRRKINDDELMDRYAGLRREVNTTLRRSR